MYVRMRGGLVLLEIFFILFFLVCLNEGIATNVNGGGAGSADSQGKRGGVI